MNFLHINLEDVKPSVSLEHEFRIKKEEREKLAEKDWVLYLNEEIKSGITQYNILKRMAEMRGDIHSIGEIWKINLMNEDIINTIQWKKDILFNEKIKFLDESKFDINLDKFISGNILHFNEEAQEYVEDKRRSRLEIRNFFSSEGQKNFIENINKLFDSKISLREKNEIIDYIIKIELLKNTGSLKETEKIFKENTLEIKQKRSTFIKLINEKLNLQDFINIIQHPKISNLPNSEREKFKNDRVFNSFLLKIQDDLHSIHLNNELIKKFYNKECEEIEEIQKNILRLNGGIITIIARTIAFDIFSFFVPVSGGAATFVSVSSALATTIMEKIKNSLIDLRNKKINLLKEFEPEMNTFFLETNKITEEIKENFDDIKKIFKIAERHEKTLIISREISKFIDSMNSGMKIMGSKMQKFLKSIDHMKDNFIQVYRNISKEFELSGTLKILDKVSLAFDCIDLFINVNDYIEEKNIYANMKAEFEKIKNNIEFKNQNIKENLEELKRQHFSVKDLPEIIEFKNLKFELELSKKEKEFLINPKYGLYQNHYLWIEYYFGDFAKEIKKSINSYVSETDCSTGYFCSMHNYYYKNTSTPFGADAPIYVYYDDPLAGLMGFINEEHEVDDGSFAKFYSELLSSINYNLDNIYDIGEIDIVKDWKIIFHSFNQFGKGKNLLTSEHKKEIQEKIKTEIFKFLYSNKILTNIQFKNIDVKVNFEMEEQRVQRFFIDLSFELNLFYGEYETQE